MSCNAEKNSLVGSPHSHEKSVNFSEGRWQCLLKTPEQILRYPCGPGEENSRQKMLEVLADEIGDGVWRLALAVATFQSSPIFKQLRPPPAESELWPEQQ